MAAAGAAAGAGKKLALGALGAFSGVGAAVAYKLDQSVKVRTLNVGYIIILILSLSRLI